MKPDVPLVLNGIAATLATHVLPELRTPFGQQNVGIASQLCAMIAQEFDRAAARLVEENRALISLFERAIPVLDDGPLREQLQQAIATPPGSDLRISALQAENDRLRALLITLHAQVEEIDTPEGSALNERIWDELRESTRRRKLTSGLA